MSIPNVFTLDTRNCLVVVVARGKRVNRRRFMAGFTPVDPLIVFRCFAINLLLSSVISRNGVAFRILLGFSHVFLFFRVTRNYKEVFFLSLHVYFIF